MALSATRVKALKEPGRYSDGGGLHLYISKAGRKSWVLRITIDGRRRDIGLGGFPSVGLAQAREKAADHRAAVAEGRDPLAEKHAPAMPTFREAACAVHEANRPRWRNASHIASWMQTLERDAMPTLIGVNYYCRSCCLIGKCYRNLSLWSQLQPERSRLLQRPTASAGQQRHR